MPGTISQYQVVIPGQTITASLWNGMENNIIDNGLVWSGIDDYSVNDAQMQVQTDPYPASTTSRPTSAQGELERLRFILAQITGKTYWYQDPDQSIATAKTNFDAHTHDGTSNNGPQIAAAGLASDSVTTAKILDSNVTTAKIADLNVTTGKIADLGVTTGKINDLGVTTGKIDDLAVTTGKLAADAVTGAKLADDSVDSEHIVDGSIDEAHLSAGVLALMSPASIQQSSVTVILTLTGANTVVSTTGNATITSVDTSKSYVIFNGITYPAESFGAGDTVQSIDAKVELTSATNVEVIASAMTLAGASGTISVKVWFTVVEWN